MRKSAMPDGKLNNKQWLPPATLIRVGSILIVGLMIGHMSAYPWTSIKAPQETQLTMLMKSVPFEFMGQRSTYWNLYFGWGVLVAVLLLALASILWILPDFATLRPRSAGAISAIVAIGQFVRRVPVVSLLLYTTLRIILDNLCDSDRSDHATTKAKERMKPIRRKRS